VARSRVLVFAICFSSLLTCLHLSFSTLRPFSSGQERPDWHYKAPEGWLIQPTGSNIRSVLFLYLGRLICGSAMLAARREALWLEDDEGIMRRNVDVRSEDSSDLEVHVRPRGARSLTPDSHPSFFELNSNSSYGRSIEGNSIAGASISMEGFDTHLCGLRRMWEQRTAALREQLDREKLVIRPGEAAVLAAKEWGVLLPELRQPSNNVESLVSTLGVLVKDPPPDEPPREDSKAFHPQPRGVKEQGDEFWRSLGPDWSMANDLTSAGETLFDNVRSAAKEAKIDTETVEHLLTTLGWVDRPRGRRQKADIARHRITVKGPDLRGFYAKPLVKGKRSYMPQDVIRSRLDEDERTLRLIEQTKCNAEPTLKSVISDAQAKRIELSDKGMAWAECDAYVKCRQHRQAWIDLLREEKILQKRIYKYKSELGLLKKPRKEEKRIEPPVRKVWCHYGVYCQKGRYRCRSGRECERLVSKLYATSPEEFEAAMKQRLMYRLECEPPINTWSCATTDSFEELSTKSWQTRTAQHLSDDCDAGSEPGYADAMEFEALAIHRCRFEELEIDQEIPEDVAEFEAMIVDDVSLPSKLDLWRQHVASAIANTKSRKSTFKTKSKPTQAKARVKAASKSNTQQLVCKTNLSAGSESDSSASSSVSGSLSSDIDIKKLSYEQTMFLVNELSD
jgi:hypothetical protein